MTTIKEYIVEAYIQHRKLFMYRYDFHKIKRHGLKNNFYNRHHNRYFLKAKVTEEQLKRIESKLKKKGIKYKIYESMYQRSSNYRKIFMEANQGPYRCRYCHRFVPLRKLKVDHIIPVKKAQYDKKAQFLLKIQGIKNINSAKNLAPACPRCNYAKSTKMGRWAIKGILGRYHIYWFIKNVLKLAGFIAAVLIIYILCYSSENNMSVYEAGVHLCNEWYGYFCSISYIDLVKYVVHFLYVKSLSAYNVLKEFFLYQLELSEIL